LRVPETAPASRKQVNLMKTAVQSLIAVAIFALMTVSSGSQPEIAQAQTPSPYCQVGSALYNATTCANITTYCTVGSATYNITLCQAYGGTPTGTTTGDYYCQPATYNAALCNTSNYYCQPATYNAALCNTSASTNYYCQPATYNATLCAQTSTAGNIYCQPATYNAALCAQSTTSGSIYCQTGTANYNATLCAQYTQSQPTEVVVRTNASGLDCSGIASINVTVRSLTGAAVPDGTTVTLTATQGTISPASGVTTVGVVNASYSAPPIGTGSATITATAGSAKGTAIIALNCIPRVPTAVPTPVIAIPQVPVQPPVTLPAPVSPGAILPPNTGDGGLLSD
jgi:hypothetical protein